MFFHPSNKPSAVQKSPSKLFLRKLEFSGETVTEETICSGVGVATPFQLKMACVSLSVALVSASGFPGDPPSGASLPSHEGPAGRLHHLLPRPGQPQAHPQPPPVRGRCRPHTPIVGLSPHLTHPLSTS